MPVMQPTRFELVFDLKTAGAQSRNPTDAALIINLKTAKSLGLEVSPALLVLADEVIE
jgi:hypothetical protein